MKVTCDHFFKSSADKKGREIKLSSQVIAATNQNQQTDQTERVNKGMSQQIRFRLD